ncbi:MAG: trehalose-phosphatase, partial [Coleofasciculus sp. C2-GNP5-27]
LRQHGADVVVRDLRNISVTPEKTPQSLPSALEQIGSIETRLRDRQLALFTDYDGTLTPIVPRPEAATLSQDMRSLLLQLSDQVIVAVISGRDLADVQNMVGIDKLYYAGSHGFDVAGGGIQMQQQQAQASLPELDEAENQLREQLKPIAGAKVERKRFAIALHYREVAESDVERIRSIVDQVVQNYPQLRQSRGKKIFELQPDVPWDKGRAICWLLDKLDINTPDVLPMYLGDDTTDEDAFQALRDRGIGIRVGMPDEPTQANYYLQNPDEVKQFFQALLKTLDERN